MPTPLVWRCSYETFEFNTLDGDLGILEYAQHPDKIDHWVIRVEDKLRWNTRSIEKSQYDTTGKVLVTITGKAYYDEFIIPNGKIVRFKTTKNKYKDLSKKNKPQPSYEATDEELLLWQ